MKSVKVILVCMALILSTMRAFGADVDAGISAFQSGRYPEALRILLPLANSGNDEAQRVVGEMCYGGKGMKRDFVASFKWTELAAESGNRIAQYNLGYLYERGEGVPASRAKSIDWYTKSSVQGYFAAQHRLGDIYASSERSKAIYWYELAAQSGDDAARKKFSALSSATVADKREEDQRQQAERDAEARREEAERRARNDQAERDRQMAANDNSYSPPQRNSTPFDGLNSINRVMRNGQAQIAAAQAARTGTRNTETVMRAAEAQERYAALSRPTVPSESRPQQTSSSSRNAVQDTSDRPSPAAQRTACVNEEKYGSNDYSESVARAFLQKKIDGAKTTTETMVNDPYRYLGDSGITCQKEATTVNPEYKCSVTIKSEVKLYGACGNSSRSTAGVSK